MNRASETVGHHQVHCCSVAKACLTLCDPTTAAHQAPLCLLSPGACSHSCMLSQRCCPAISSSALPSPFAFNLSQHQSFPVRWFFASGGQSIGASASASVLPVNIQRWFPLGWTGLISLQSKGLSRSSTTIWSHQFFCTEPSYSPTLTFVRDYWKNHCFDYKDLCRQSDISVVLFNTQNHFS